MSERVGIRLRRVELPGGRAYAVRPPFALPDLTARAADAEPALFLRRFGVPYWAPARAFGRSRMPWLRPECAPGRNSVAGPTVRRGEAPADLLADEHRQTRDGAKVYLATTVGGGRCLGVGVGGAAGAAGAADPAAAYGTFLAEARDVAPGYAPRAVNTDGWRGTTAAWAAPAPAVAPLRCFLHGWLKVRDSGKHPGQTSYDLPARARAAYHAAGKRSFARRRRRVREWAGGRVAGAAPAAVLDLCRKKDLWLAAHDHPAGHRASNVLDRVMRPMCRCSLAGQHLRGRSMTGRHVRGWAPLGNVAPWSPAATRANAGWRSPAERLNQHRDHDDWLQNLLISASLGGYRREPQNP